MNGEGFRCKCGIQECLQEILQAIQLEPEDAPLRHLICVGAYIAMTYAASLHGYKTFFMNLAAFRKYLAQGVNHQ